MVGPMRGMAGAGLVVGAVIVLLLGNGGLGLGPLGVPSVRSVARGPVHPAGSSGLEVNPQSWTMVAGSSVELHAALAPASDGCVPSYAVISWQMSGLSALLGTLNGTIGGATIFASYPYVTGSAALTATAVGIELCSLIPRNFSASVTATVTLVPPLSVADVLPASDPVRPDRPVELSSAVSGGLAPYRVTFDFGDGSNATALLASAGPVSLAHPFAPGSYPVRVTATDALGERASAGTESPIVVAADLAAAILPAAPAAEVGVPFGLNATVVGGVGPISGDWSDGAGDGAIGTSWSWVPLLPGPATVSFRATDADGASVNASITLNVAPPLTPTVVAGRSVVGVGQPLPVTVEIGGGVAPFSVTLGSAPAGSLVELRGVRSSSLPEVLMAAAPGPMWATVAVTDRLGVAVANELPVAEIVARPYLTANASGPTAEVGVPFGIFGLAGGTGPFNWSLAATLPLRSGTALTPLVAGPSLFGWTGVPAAGGTALFELSVTDATGAVATQNLSVRVVPALTATLTAANTTVGSAAALLLDLQGGSGPYRGTLTASDGSAVPVATNSDGVVPLAWSPRAAGVDMVHLAITDALGATAFANLSVTAVAPSSPGPTPSPAPNGPAPAPSPGAPPSGPARAGTPGDLTTFAGGLLVGLLSAGLLGLAWRRYGRRPGAPVRPPAPEVPRAALDAIRRIVRGTDGIDRETLLLLAEEEGLEAAAAQGALDRWLALGRIERHEDPRNGTTYRWTRPAPGAEAAPPSGEEATEA